MALSPVRKRAQAFCHSVRSSKTRAVPPFQMMGSTSRGGDRTALARTPRSCPVRARSTRTPNHPRPAERRLGKEWVVNVKSGVSPIHLKKKKKIVDRKHDKK